jgi:LysW-gamma-L-lysine carboxypeptidase
MQIDPVQFLQELVAIPSVSGEETAVAQFLTTRMNEMGLAAHIDEAGNAVGVRENVAADGRIHHEIVLLGHMDTVPGDIPVRLEAGKLYGRGAVDAKGPLAAFVVAAAQADLPPGTRLVVIGAVEEESAASKGARFVAAQYRPDWCIIGEPSGWDGVTLGYKGRILIDYEYAQPMSHTAGQTAGAAETGIAWYNELMAYVEAFNFDQTRLFNRLLLSIRHIHTDSDGLTNRVRLKVGVRLPPGFDIDEFQADVTEWADEADLRFYGYEPAFQSKRTTPLAQAFNRILRQRGVRPRFKLKTGTSDMNVVGPVWNCPIVAYGPGDSSLDHTPQEHIITADYLRAIEVLREVITSLSS